VFDELVDLSDKTLAIKIDVERYEREVLDGMTRTLRNNSGFVQVEVLEERDTTVRMMTECGYVLVREFGFNLIFSK
jgi:hypothetical protein